MINNLSVITINKRAWERVADTFSKRDPVEVSKTFEYFYNELSNKARVLDVGSGTGVPLTKILVEYGLSSSRR